MESFDEWFGEASQNKLFWESPSKASKMGFEAGQQSKQTEVDELHKRIDEIENHVEINYDCERSDDNHSYWSGYNQAMRELFEILKGEHK